jgi:curved DNA-binding protein CbpA
MEKLIKAGVLPADKVTDYYEFFQISPTAEPETIHRIYRFHATRYHPDNPVTGDPEKFLVVQRAFEVLSDPKRRAEYDRTRQRRESEPIPMSASIDFMDGVQGEVNRRLAILSLLYNKRRTNSDFPEVSLAEVETVMGFPRDYLNFATWYLKSKNYITKSDNSDFALTALGVDYVESNCESIPIFNRLLNTGSATPGSSQELIVSNPADADIEQVESAGVNSVGSPRRKREQNGAG